MQMAVMEIVPDDLKDEKSMVPGQVFDMHKGDDVRLPDECNCVTIGLGASDQNLQCDDTGVCSVLKMGACQAGIAMKLSTWTHP